LAAVRLFGGEAHALLVLDLLDGRVITQWSCPGEMNCRLALGAVSDSGAVALSQIVYGTVRGVPPTIRWALIGPGGEVAYEELVESERIPFLVLSSDGRRLVRMSRGGVAEYVLRK
jgi:hypothetical protein